MAHRTQEKWSRLIAEYQTSKESMSEFCARHQISESSLYYWIAKIQPKKQTSVKMLPVVTLKAKSTDVVDLFVPNGLRLRFLSGTSAQYVADIIKAFL
jgi:transposase-like protein